MCRTVLAALVAASYLVLVIQADNHCASTRFGCCDDGVTIATRKDKSGCPPGKSYSYLTRYLFPNFLMHVLWEGGRCIGSCNVCNGFSPEDSVFPALLLVGDNAFPSYSARFPGRDFQCSEVYNISIRFVGLKLLQKIDELPFSITMHESICWSHFYA